MEIIYVEDFYTGGNEYTNYYDYMVNISNHCNSINDEFMIYSRGEPLYTFEKKLTFPKVVYVQYLTIVKDKSLFKSLPDLKRVGNLQVHFFMEDLGPIKEIDNFFSMSSFLKFTMMDTFRKGVMRCTSLGDNMFKFTSRKGSWVIKVNQYS